MQRIAKAWSELMSRLGYKRYAAQGGDWGAAVTTCIGFQDTANCLGIHVNMPLILHLLVRIDPSSNDLTEAEKSALAGVQYYNDWDSGYSKEQSTRPQTVGYGLTDSPVGQMAWILREVLGMDRLRRPSGERPDPRRTARQCDDVLADGYRGLIRATLLGEFPRDSDRSGQIPAGCSIFPKEIFRSSRRWVEQRYTKLVYFNELAKGGHFAAFEQPETFVREIRACFRQIRQPRNRIDLRIPVLEQRHTVISRRRNSSICSSLSFSREVRTASVSSPSNGATLETLQGLADIFHGMPA